MAIQRALPISFPCSFWTAISTVPCTAAFDPFTICRRRPRYGVAQLVSTHSGATTVKSAPVSSIAWVSVTIPAPISSSSTLSRIFFFHHWRFLEQPPPLLNLTKLEVEVIGAVYLGLKVGYLIHLRQTNAVDEESKDKDAAGPSKNLGLVFSFAFFFFPSSFFGVNVTAESDFLSLCSSCLWLTFFFFFSLSLQSRAIWPYFLHSKLPLSFRRSFPGLHGVRYHWLFCF